MRMARNSQFGHDDRMDMMYHQGGRKPRKHRNRFGPRFDRGPGGNRARYEDLDGDVDMAGPGASRNPDRRFNPYKPNKKKYNKNNKNRNNRGPPPYSRSRHGDDPEGTWYKIIIPNGKQLDKQFIVKSISSACRQDFVPFNFQYHNAAAIFYLDNFNIAHSIRNLKHRITTPMGTKMLIQVRDEDKPPVSVVNPEVLEAIKACMSRHYDLTTHSLDLGRFHHDAGLRESGHFIPLHKPIIFSAVVKIIKDNIPEIERLDLSHNRLYSLEILGNLAPVCRNLVALNLRRNTLKTIAVLNSLKGLDIAEIILDGNPLCNEYKDQASYISDIRKRLPKVMRLDERELPAPITFDLGGETVPPSKGSYAPSPDAQKLVVQFLQEYYNIYDSGDREKLLDAYHEQAVFSLTGVRPLSSKGDFCLQEYFTKSRNLLRVTNSDLRNKLLRQGRLSVVSALNSLPRTQHDPNSFTMDISLITNFLMSFTVCGVFKEVGTEYTNAPLRSFSRTFVVVPQGSGCVICNETLSITNASAEQVKAFKFAPPTPSPSPAPVCDKTIEEKQLLVTTFSNETGMNIDFSAKCLEEYEWDYQKAFIVFSELKALGRIPQEAFVK